MRKSQIPAVLGLVLGLAGVVAAAEVVAPRGGSTQYPTQIEVAVGGKPVPMVLTGAALRTRYFVNVYTIASYVQAGAPVKTPADLAGVEAVKRLQIVMERDVSGTDMAEAFRSAIRANYPEPTFNEEVSSLVEQVKAHNLKKGDTVVLTHVPGFGLAATIVGKGDFVIKNPKFSKAVWDIYLGPKNLGEEIKTSMSNRL